MHLGLRKSQVGSSPSPSGQHECRLHFGMICKISGCVKQCHFEPLRPPRHFQAISSRRSLNSLELTYQTIQLVPYLSRKVCLTCHGIGQPSEHREFPGHVNIATSSNGSAEHDDSFAIGGKLLRIRRRGGVGLERYFAVQVIRLHYKSTCCCKRLTDVCGKRIFVPVERGSPLLEPLVLFLDMLLEMCWNSDH